MTCHDYTPTSPRIATVEGSYSRALMIPSSEAASFEPHPGLTHMGGRAHRYLHMPPPSPQADLNLPRFVLEQSARYDRMPMIVYGGLFGTHPGYCDWCTVPSRTYHRYEPGTYQLLAASRCLQRSPRTQDSSSTLTVFIHLSPIIFMVFGQSVVLINPVLLSIT